MSAPVQVDNSGIVPQTSRNLNTILLWCVCTMLGAVGACTFYTALNLAFLKGSMVSRPEVVAMIAEVNAKQLSLEKDLIALKLALAERGIKERN